MSRVESSTVTQVLARMHYLWQPVLCRYARVSRPENWCPWPLTSADSVIRNEDREAGDAPAASIPKELQRQYLVAVAQGIPVEWRVQGPKSAEAIQRIIEQRGYDDMINVVVIPAE
ncbi:hypothetical protein A5722_32315 [Mycobacterium vulneris]|nr:hypothetical protein A5722_32315 [Mycolicibacterium vulneris]OCB67827.1 hypothetical protein A5729_06790 [Mycolicibacterium vulneris]